MFLGRGELGPSFKWKTILPSWRVEPDESKRKESVEELRKQKFLIVPSKILQRLNIKAEE